MDYSIDVYSHGCFVNSGQDILWAGPASLQSACPFSYFFIEVSPGTFASVSISVMALLEAIPGLTSGRFTSLSHPWRLDGLPALRVMELSSWNESHVWSSPRVIHSDKQQKLWGHLKKTQLPLPTWDLFLI